MATTIKTSKKVYTGPSHWGQMTMRTYVKLGKEWNDNDILRAISIVTGCPYPTLYNMPDDKLDSILVAFAYLKVDPKFKDLKVPELVGLPGVPANAFVMPKKVTHFSIGQNMLVRRKMAEVELIDEAVAYALAVFSQPALNDGKFDSEKVDELEQYYLDSLCNDIYPAGFFVLGHVAKRGTTLLQRIALTLLPSPRLTSTRLNWLKSNVSPTTPT